jgi:site-specific DNA-methyltransferase (adenine-specific)
MAASPLDPFGFSTDKRGQKEKDKNHTIALRSSAGISYISKAKILKGEEFINKYKVFVGKMGAEHGLEPDKEGKFRIITSSLCIGGLNEICTHSYFIAGSFENLEEARNLYSYLRTKFTRFLILLSMSSPNLSRSVFCFLPSQDFTKRWEDKELFEKYGLSDEEISFIGSLMKDML